MLRNFFDYLEFRHLSLPRDIQSALIQIRRGAEYEEYT